MVFEWDEVKSEWTKSKRDLDFPYASTVFIDPERVEEEARSKKQEARFSVIGKAAFGEILFVVFTWRHYENEKVCRIISARKASKKERSRYPRIR
jgi:uncharacterized DUF497 family protein